jgi:hypothetical protein
MKVDLPRRHARALYSLVLEQMMQGGGMRQWIDLASETTVTIEDLLALLSSIVLANSQGEAAAPHQKESQQADPKAMQGDGLGLPIVADRIDDQADNTDDH